MKFLHLLVLVSPLLWAGLVGSQTRQLNGNRNSAGLLAQRLGVAPVPGGDVSTGVELSGPAQRDGSCWCQPINQVCTELRPQNLDLVTSIGFDGQSTAGIGLPGIPNPAVASTCESDQRQCCPTLRGDFFHELFGAAAGANNQANDDRGTRHSGTSDSGSSDNDFSITDLLNQEFHDYGFPNQEFLTHSHSPSSTVNFNPPSANRVTFQQDSSNQGNFQQDFSNQENFQQDSSNQGNPQDFTHQGNFNQESRIIVNGGVILNDHSTQCGARQGSGHPWAALVQGPGDGYIAGGVLIGDSWVLTAPHALSRRSGLKVRLGFDGGNSHFQVPVQRVIVHSQFNGKTLTNDMALLELAQPISRGQFPHVRPACLPFQGQKFDGQRCTVLGGSKDVFSHGSFQRNLLQVDVPVIEGFRCESMFRRTRLGRNFNLDQQSFLCAGGEENRDTCEGDGGSPLLCEGGGQGWTVVGLVAWGVGCAQRDVPGAYVNVASYINFIRQYVQ